MRCVIRKGALYTIGATTLSVRDLIGGSSGKLSLVGACLPWVIVIVIGELDRCILVTRCMKLLDRDRFVACELHSTLFGDRTE